MANRTTELNIRPNSTNDPDAIRTEIENTRAAMGHTISEIQERLSPARLKQQTQEAIREATIGKVEDMTHQAEHKVRSWRTNLVRTVKENPIPAALIGVGVGWLLMADNDTDYYPQSTQYYSGPDRLTERYGTRAYDTRHEARHGVGEMVHHGRERVGEVAEEAKERAGAAVHQVQERIGDAAESVQEHLHDAAESVQQSAAAAGRQVRQSVQETQHHAQETAAHLRTRAQIGMRRTKRTFWETMNENPLAVGATALAAGALVGLALPSTEVENRWMGEHRDELLDEAKEVVQTRAQETARKVQAVATKAKDAAVETAKEEANKAELQPVTNGRSKTSSSS